MQIAERVQKVLAKVAAVDAATVKPESSLQHFLDSAASLEFLLALEEEFGVELADDATTEAKTVADVVKLLEQQGARASSG